MNSFLAEIGKILIEAEIEHSKNLRTRPFFALKLAGNDRKRQRQTEDKPKKQGKQPAQE
jgi:hypothetical protein